MRATREKTEIDEGIEQLARVAEARIEHGDITCPERSETCPVGLRRKFRVLFQRRDRTIRIAFERQDEAQRQPATRKRAREGGVLVRGRQRHTGHRSLLIHYALPLALALAGDRNGVPQRALHAFIGGAPSIRRNGLQAEARVPMKIDVARGSPSAALACPSRSGRISERQRTDFRRSKDCVVPPIPGVVGRTSMAGDSRRRTRTEPRSRQKAWRDSRCIAGY